MVSKGVADDESVVCVTPVEGSVKDFVPDVKEPQADEKAAEKSGKEDKEDAKSEDGEKKDEEKVHVGMVCDTKNLYQKWDRHNRFTWSEETPEDLEEAAENETTVKYAILVRNKKSYDSRKKLEIDSIVVQSPYLKNVLQDVLKDYPGVTTKLKRLTFSAPFKPFVHRWAEFTRALTSDDYDEVTKSHMKLLYDMLQTELKDVISALKDYTNNEVITYEHIWTIFQPGCTVLGSRYGRPIAMRLEQGTYGEHNRFGQTYIIKADRVDWDGSKFGFDSAQSVILPFVGTIPITDLEIYPLQFHPDSEAMREKLLERGRLFEEMAGYHFKSYKGKAIEHKQFGISQVSLDSRIVIDAFAYNKFRDDNNTRSLTPLNHVESRIQADNDDDDVTYNNNFYSDDDDDDLMLDHDGKAVPLTEEQLLLCTPMIKGYALKPKKWLEFFVDGVEDVTFNQRAFENLVLPDGHKSMILAFAQSQVKNKDRFTGDIDGKGKGMIMLLSGGPGIGKTLTAEAVAEVMGVPLYVMSAGDLGTYSGEIEEKLGKVLEMATKWNAVLLLDECDAFLEARNATDLDRNRIVSIFLRTLEYYEGILFMTTNRVKNMDEAFQSRIHISLEYPPLDRPARRRVWQGFLERRDSEEEKKENKDEDGGADASNAPLEHELTDAQVDRLAKLEINGRVIKNVLKTSSLLAAHQGKKLGYEHLKTVLRVEGHSIE